MIEYDYVTKKRDEVDAFPGERHGLYPRDAALGHSIPGGGFSGRRTAA